MKTLSLALLAAATLAGCVVIPAEPAPYVSPPRAYIGVPGVVVAPSVFFGGYYRHHGGWR